MALYATSNVPKLARTFAEKRVILFQVGLEFKSNDIVQGLNVKFR
jgi:hypothetical protein